MRLSWVRKLEDQNISYTYADYPGWETDKRYEIIDGEALDVSILPGLGIEFIPIRGE